MPGVFRNITIFHSILLLSITPIAAYSIELTDTILFERIYLEAGNSFGIVEDIQQDTSGFIWIGAKDGLFRYDGKSFISYYYERNDSNSLSNNVIRDIFVDSRGKMWVGTENGLNLFQPQKNHFQRFQYNPDKPESLAGNNIRKIIEDNKGNLWIATLGGGVCKYDVKSSKFINLRQIIHSDSNLDSLHIRTIYRGRNNIIWFGTVGKGVFYFNPDSLQLHQLPLGRADGKHLTSNDIRSIVEDHEGRIWIGTNDKGLICCRLNDRSFTYYNPQQTGLQHIDTKVIWNLYLDSKQNLWVSTDGGGLLLYNHDKENFIAFRTSESDPTSISSDVVRVFYEDNAGNYWIGNFNAPINFINTHRKKIFQLKDFDESLKSSNQNKVTSVMCDSENDLWICTDGAGLFQYNTDKERFINYKAVPGSKGHIFNNKPLCITEDQQGNIWIGLFEGGLSCYHKKQDFFVNYFPDGTSENPKSSQIWDILIKNNILWIAGDQGIESLDLGTGYFNHNPFPDYNQPIYSAWNLMFDSNNRLWIGTINGLFVFNPSRNNIVHLYSYRENPESLSDNWVLSLLEDKNNRIWIGTNGGGLNLWNGDDEFQCFLVKDGLPGNVINGILPDDAGNLWISTNGGISRFNPDKEEFTNFDIEDGLQDNRFNINSCYRDNSGIIYFGGINGLNYFDPKEIVTSKFIPPVVIEELEIFNKSSNSKGSTLPSRRNILYEDEIHIYPSQLIFTIRFAALNFSHPHRNQYKFKLDGFDDNWNEVGNQNWATYTNLRPGNYVFRVLGSNDDGVWNTKGAQLRIVVHPPFYRTGWFIAILVSLLVLLVVSVYRIRVQSIRIHSNRLSELVSKRTRELENRNEEIANQNTEIRRQNEELEKHRNRLEELVEERTQDLVIAKERAEESDRLKTAFLENLSHQIRTPMNAIIGFINLLSEKIDDKLSRDYYLRIINESGRNMLHLIEDIIDFSRMQTGHLQPEYSECNISELIRHLVSNLRERVSRDNPSLSILTDIPASDIVMIADEKKLSQILSKLVENSLKFTEKGFIKIGITKLEDKEITFFVEDSGIGIDEKDIDKVFDRFFTVEEENSTKNFRGSGLGLPFAKTVTNILGGKIWVESKKSEGSTFYFTLPYLKVTSATSSIQEGDEKKYHWPGKTLLVAEDEESNYLLIEAILKDAGVTLIHVLDGVELLEKIHDNIQFDLVLLDLKMPRMGGINALKIIRESLTEVPIIVQTAYDQASQREQCREFGCNEFLVKPLRKNELLQLLDCYLG